MRTCSRRTCRRALSQGLLRPRLTGIYHVPLHSQSLHRRINNPWHDMHSLIQQRCGMKLRTLHPDTPILDSTPAGLPFERILHVARIN